MSGDFFYSFQFFDFCRFVEESQIVESIGCGLWRIGNISWNGIGMVCGIGDA